MAPTTRYNWRFTIHAENGETREEYAHAPLIATPDDADREADRLVDEFIFDTGLAVTQVTIHRYGEARPAQKPSVPTHLKNMRGRS